MDWPGVRPEWIGPAGVWPDIKPGPVDDAATLRAVVVLKPRGKELVELADSDDRSVTFFIDAPTPTELDELDRRVRAGVACYALPIGPAVILGGTLIWSLGEIAGGPATFAYSGIAAPPGLKIGAFQFMFDPGTAIGPIIGGWLAVQPSRTPRLAGARARLGAGHRAGGDRVSAAAGRSRRRWGG